VGVGLLVQVVVQVHLMAKHIFQQRAVPDGVDHFIWSRKVLAL